MSSEIYLCRIADAVERIADALCNQAEDGRSSHETVLRKATAKRGKAVNPGWAEARKGRRL